MRGQRSLCLCVVLKIWNPTIFSHFYPQNSHFLAVSVTLRFKTNIFLNSTVFFCTGYHIFLPLICTWGDIFQHNHQNNSDFCPYFIIFSQNANFSHFRCSEWPIIYQTPIGKWVFWLKWGVYHHHSTNGSRDIKICPFYPLFSQSANFSHFCCSEWPIIYQTPIGKCVFWLKWGVYHHYSTNGSGDMRLGLKYP